MHIYVSAGGVRRHARDVDEVSRMLDEARAAAAHIRASSSAYGPLFGALVADHYLNPRADEAIGSYTRAVDGLRALADHLRVMADAYDHSDDRAAEELRRTE